MSHSTLAVISAIFIWWFSTGLIFVIARKGERRRGPITLAATVVTVFALAMIYVSAQTQTVTSAYVAFGAALTVWAWHELLFLFGMVAGPRHIPATPGLTGAERFREAFSAVRNHELMLAGTVLVIIALTWNAPNHVGLWTFILLWTLRVSAKLSIFFGARNSLNEMMPQRLIYLTTYFRTDRTSPFLHAVIFVGLLSFAALCILHSTSVDSYSAVSIALIATLLGLAVMEHIFLMLPIPDSVLWLWAAPKPETNETSKSRGFTRPESPENQTIKGEGVSWT